MSFGDRTLYKNATFLVRPGDRIGLVGPNGSGKSTLFKIMTGVETPDEGSVSVDAGVVIGYFSQDVGEMTGSSVLEEVLSGAGEVFEIGRKLTDLEHRMASEEGLNDKEMDLYGELQMAFVNRDGYELDNKAETILEGLGFDKIARSRSVDTFSGGWKMRIALAKILLLNPDLLLMDEPTNHLDMESIVWLEEWLKNFEGSLVMTSHDRQFMTRLCNRTIEVAGETITMYSGDYDFYLQERHIRREQLIAAYNKQQASIAKDEEFIARFKARASHAAQVQSRVKMLEKLERIVIPPEPKVMKFEFAQVRRSGDRVINFDNLSKVWTDEERGNVKVFEGLCGDINRGDKIAVTGVNGAGKSTLLKIMCQQVPQTSGTIQIGSSVDLGYFSQYSSDLLHDERTIFEEITHRLPDSTIGYRKTLLGAFQFSGDDVDKNIGLLSGGEKSRVVLASILANPVNCLILDEPTNHLDITSREVLLEALKCFEGTLIIVSHDRYFLTQLVNRVFEIDHGKLNVYEGDYPYYLSKKA